VASDDRASGRDGGGWLEGWSFDRQMAVAVGLPIVFLLAGAILMNAQTDQIGEAEDRVEEQRRSLTGMIELKRAFLGVVEASHTYVMTGETQNRSRLESQITTFQMQVDEVDQPFDDPERQSTFVEMQENATAYIELVRRAQDDMEAGNETAAQARLTGPQASQARTRTEAALGRLVDRERQILNDQREAIREQHSDLDQAILWGSLAAVLTSAVVGYRTVSTIDRDLERDAGTLEERLADLETVLEDASGRVNAEQETTLEIEDHLAQLQAQARDVHAKVDALGQVATTVESWAEDGRRRVDRTRERLGNVEDGVGEFTEQILDVSEEVDHLERSADTLADTADRIDVLALNASVAASRSGADTGELTEIRDLAEQAKTEAQALEAIADEAHESSETAAVVIERTRKAIEETRTSADDVDDWLEQIVDRLADSQQQTATVREAAADQAQALDAVGDDVEGTRERAAVAADRHERAQQLVDELQAVADSLDAMR
jgi:uncharacterized coiled-coil DUF342 family protein